MKLLKKEFIYNTRGDRDWNRSYAAGPVVDVLNDKVWRIYYVTRDSFNHSRTTFLDVEAENPTNILYEHDKYLIDLGDIGTFDDCGATVSSISNFNGKKYMYYLGWNIRNTVFCHNAMGLAISEDGGVTFKKFDGPVMNTTYKEPYSIGAGYTLFEKELGILRHYYVSYIKWQVINGHPEPIYHIKYAESKNGLDWDRQQIVSVDFREGETGGIARPSVIKENDNLYRMWYTYRDAADFRTNKAHSYRIGYAESTDGKVFTRMDEKAGITPPDTGWDNMMQEYPCVVKSSNKYWMFYNGNTFGQSGFGYAVFEED